MATVAGETVQRVSNITEKVRKYVENHNFLCPISKQIMAEPVFAVDGHTYEYESIKKHLETDNRSPLKGASLRNRDLIVNQGKKGEILEYLRKHPELYDEDEVYLPRSWIIGLAAAIKANIIKEVQEYLARDRRLLTLKLEGDYTVFHLAAEFGSKELTDNLLGSFIRRNVLDKLPKPPAGFKPIYLNELLEKSLIEADKDKFSLLLKLGAELNQIEEGTENTLLHKLAIQGNPAPVKWLLERGISIEDRNVEGNTPLLLAVLHNRLEITWPLLDKKANPKAKNNQNQSAIAVALLKQNTTLLTVLVGREKAALPPLHLALALNDIDLLKALLKQDSAKTSLEALDPMGRTPLYALIAKDSKEMKEKEEAVRLLLEAGADVTVACGTEKLTALHLAASQGDLGLFKLLLPTKAVTLIDAEDSQGNTPLHLAAQAGHDEVVAYLLEAGADHEARNHEDQTPIELAREQNKVKTAAFITQKVRALKRAQSEEFQRLRQKITDLEQVVYKQSEQIKEQSAQIDKLKGASKPSQVRRGKKRKAKDKSPVVVCLSDGSRQYEVDVPSDGTCLFYSVSFAYLVPVKDDLNLFTVRFIKLFGEEVADSVEENRKRFVNYDGSSRFITDNAEALEVLVNINFRKRLVDFMKQQKKELSEFIPQAEDFDTRMERMGDPGRREWGDQPEIEAISRFLNMRVSVYQKQGRKIAPVPGAEHGQRYEQRIRLVHTTANERFPRGKNHYHYLIDKQYIQPALDKQLETTVDQCNSSAWKISSSDQSGVQRSPLIFSNSSKRRAGPKREKKQEAEALTELQKFLNHVAAGEQNEAEAMLKQNRDLALASGTVTDHAKRTFKNITGFQYAVWALDWQMWRMIKSYLSKEVAEEQARGFAEGSWVKEYGEHADWKKLTEAHQTLIDNWQPWSYEKINEYWVQQIGGAQLLLPMHVLQEYNQPNRPFSLRPKFDTDYVLNRARCEYDVGRLGVKEGGCGLVRGGMARKALKVGELIGRIDGELQRRNSQAHIKWDRAAMLEMLKTRTHQRAELVAELQKKPGASPSK